MSGNSFKLTNQRAVILDYLKGNYDHPSVDRIYDSVRNKLPRISKKTVYSNLRFLCDKALIREVRVSGVQRYEPKQGSHHHLVCSVCGGISDIRSDRLMSHAMKVAKRSRKFYVDFCSINFYGKCSECREEDENGRRKK